MPYTEGYADDIQPAFEGMVADTGLAVIISRTVDTAALGFGKAATEGPRDHTVHPTVGADTTVKGVAVRTQTIRAEPGLSGSAYPVGDTAAILVQGVIWVRVEVAVTRGQPANLVLASGLFTNAAVAAGILAVGPGAVFETSAAANGLARIRLL